jgi:Short C-terminal domain
MGLLGDWLRGGRMKDPARGSAYVVGCSRYMGRGIMQNISMTLVVQAEGLAATQVDHQTLCHRSRWPANGQTLPVTVDRADPSRLKVEWDELSTHEDRVQEQAAAMAAAMNAGGAGDLVGQLQAMFPGAQVHVANAPGGDDDDQVARLERVAKLHQAGLLTDEEFAEAKARLIDGL